MDNDRKVLAIAGIAGSGKTTLASKISTLLDNAPIISFDDYFDFLRGWPSDMHKFLERGADVNEWRNPQMLRDIKALKKGKEIIHPATKKPLSASKVIIVEDPTGKSRSSFAKLIDYLVYVDIPNDIALQRVLSRWFNRVITRSDGTTGKFKEVNPEKLFEQIITYLENYLDYYREMYVQICADVEKTADLRVDALTDPEDLASFIVARFTAEVLIDEEEEEK